MPDPIQRVLNALLDDIQAGQPIRLDAAERYRAELDGYIVQFEGEDDLLHCSVTRADGGLVELEAAHGVVEPFFRPMPKGVVWFKPADYSVHYYVGHDHFLEAHRAGKDAVSSS
ncbi:MAG: hypothetical protein NZM28_07840 [Fimbriimonadales bacterium]|nr:hypothetical protein [Fimbriimonadales bacterium]